MNKIVVMIYIYRYNRCQTDRISMAAWPTQGQRLGPAWGIPADGMGSSSYLPTKLWPSRRTPKILLGGSSDPNSTTWPSSVSRSRKLSRTLPKLTCGRSRTTSGRSRKLQSVAVRKPWAEHVCSGWGWLMRAAGASSCFPKQCNTDFPLAVFDALGLGP